LRCGVCGAKYTLADYKNSIENDIEDKLADVRCDRI
jgi:hypothetical protein